MGLWKLKKINVLCLSQLFGSGQNLKAFADNKEFGAKLATTAMPGREKPRITLEVGSPKEEDSSWYDPSMKE